ncbi:MAG: C1 family peptidase [Planctomycetia bacterium]|nr:C1 family peptidase [Planctomycetia bacterium]
MKLLTFVLTALVALASCAIGATIAAASERPLPKKVDLRPRFAKFGLAPLSQGSRDTCSLFAVTGVAEYERAKDVSGPAPRLSEEFLVWAANDATGLNGDQAMFIEAVQGLTRLGICDESSMPYADKTDPDRAPSDAARAEARRNGHWTAHWIKRWNVKTGLSAAELNAVKSALANDHPVAIGMRWPKQPQLTTTFIQDPPPKEEVRDGHSVVLAGYRDDPNFQGGGVFIVRNSDGPGWGQEGYAYFPYTYITDYGNDAVWLKHDPADADSPRFQPAARFEAESLKILKTSARCQPAVQPMTDWGAKQWGDGKQLFCKAENGGALELEFTLPDAGRFEIELFVTLAPDFGKLKLLLDGRVLTQQPDCFCGRVEPSGPISLGTHDLKAGAHKLGIAVTGKNALSSSHSFGIDAFELHPRR